MRRGVSLRTCPLFTFIFGFAFVRLCFANLNKVIEVEKLVHERSAVIKKVENTSLEAVHYLKKFGKLGRNYYVGINENDDTKTFLPYINCQKYDKLKCDRGNTEGCKKTVKCVVNDPIRGSQQLACFANYFLRDSSLNATFSDGEIIEPSRMDCWQQEERQLSECKEQEKCVADVRKTGKADQLSLFCCCRTHNCNRQMVYIEEEEVTVKEEPSSTTFSPMVDSSFSDIFIGLNILHIVIFFFSAFLFVAVLAVFLLSMPKLRKKLCNRSGTTNFFLPFHRHNQRDRTSRREQLKNLLGDWERREFDAQITLADGRTVHKGNITLNERVSVGRFGQVYKAFVIGADCFAAVKIMPDKNVSSWKNEMEIYSIQTIRSNQHIAEFYGGFPTETDFWLVFNFYENNSLYDLLKSNTVSFVQSVVIITSILEGLAFLHQEIAEGPTHNQKPIIVHRDIKSKNILVTAGMNVRIADFGHAMKCNSGHVMRPGKIQCHVGTIRYMSPEVLGGATGQSYSNFQQIDVYAAALVIWEVLSRTMTNETKNDMEAYALPYERELGRRNPSLKSMRKIVLEEAKRPTTKHSLSQNKTLKEIAGTMREMWVFEPDSRITSSCAKERLMRIREELNIS